MYGLEWAVLIATVAPLSLYCGEAFYPADLRRALDRPGPRVLVSTPIHLRAMMRSAGDFPRVDTVVCATAPLDPALARQVESRLGARVLEIYGCSEAGTLAHRLPTREERWRLFPGFDLTVDDQGARVAAGFLPEPVALADRLEKAADGTFRLLGRMGDLVKVAGKRASLADLTARLLAVPGVEDGVMLDSAALGTGGGERLCALVVAPGLSADTVRRRLAEVVDAAFLPRPLRVVAELPRTPTGKLPREALRALLDPGAGAP
jgi:acyl-coenzyme A synthetase/AMP-(fatty) acid ligase